MPCMMLYFILHSEQQRTVNWIRIRIVYYIIIWIRTRRPDSLWCLGRVGPVFAFFKFRCHCCSKNFFARVSPEYITVFGPPSRIKFHGAPFNRVITKNLCFVLHGFPNRYGINSNENSFLFFFFRKIRYCRSKTFLFIIIII